MSTAASLLKGSVSRTLELGAMLAATFLVTPLLVHSLGNRLYGFWTLVGAIVGYYGVLDLGLTAAAARYLSQAMGRDEPGELDRVASTALGLFCAGGAGVLAVTALSLKACPLLASGASEARLLQQLIAIMGAAAAVGFPAKVFSGLLTAGIRYDILSAISILRIVLYNAGIYLCLRAGRGVVAVALVALAATLVQYAASYGAAKARFPSLRLSASLFDRSKARAMLDYGWKILFCQAGDILRFRLDSVVIAGFLGASLVTPYAVGVRLVEGFTRLVRSTVGMMFPVFSRYEGRGDYDAIRSALLRTTKLSAVLSGFIGLSAMFYGRAFVRRWMGPGFDDSYWVAVILCAALLLDLPQSPGIQLLFGVSKHAFYARLNVCEGLANLALSVLLLKPFGILGVALGTLVEMAFFKLLLLPAYVCKTAGVPLRAYLLEGVFLSLLKTALPLAAYFLLASRFLAARYSTIAVLAGLQTALFAPLAYFFILDDEERRVISGAFKSLRGAPAAAAEAEV